jgi:uncharacterized membrane protein
LNSPSVRLQLGISWILRVGVVLSVIFEAAGLLLNYVQTGSSSFAFGGTWRVAGGNFFDFTLATVRSLVSGVNPVELVSLGIITLMFTPYFRVIASMVYYCVEKDWKYVAITSFVFLVITYALVML